MPWPREPVRADWGWSARGVITGHYQRWRTGKMTLSASPTRLTGGETVTLTLQIASDEFAGRNVQGSSISTRPDDGWSTRQTLTQTGTLHAALRQATARITLPANARASSNSWRWQASAHVDGPGTQPLSASLRLCTVLKHRGRPGILLHLTRWTALRRRNARRRRRSPTQGTRDSTRQLAMAGVVGRATRLRHHPDRVRVLLAAQYWRLRPDPITSPGPGLLPGCAGRGAVQPAVHRGRTGVDGRRYRAARDAHARDGETRRTGG